MDRGAITQQKPGDPRVFGICYNGVAMEIASIWVHFRDHWRGLWREFRDDVRRLDTASRILAVGTVTAGVLRGLIPIAALVTLYRLTDAAIGARSIGVATSDLTHALWSFGAVSLLGLALVLGSERLRGLTGKVASRAAVAAAVVSLAVCMFLLGPVRFFAIVILLVAGQTAGVPRHAGLILFLAAFALHVSLFVSAVTYLVTRSLTVGGFFLFGGAVVASATWMVIHHVRTTTA